MTQSARYEIKFVVEEIRIGEVLSWAYGHTALRKSFPARVVNSLYFDNEAFDTATDNLAGISRRKKYRLRWYGKAEQAPSAPPVIEIKNKHASLGFKERIYVDELSERLLTESVADVGHTVNSVLQASYLPKFSGELSDLRPNVHINYRREYYEDFRGFRMTIDREISFRRALVHRKIFDSMSHPYAPIVVELKFDAEDRQYVSAMMSKLHLVPQRHSKYLAGLANLGLLQYI
jgi:hypothetical protein